MSIFKKMFLLEFHTYFTSTFDSKFLFYIVFENKNVLLTFANRIRQCKRKINDDGDFM